MKQVIPGGLLGGLVFFIYLSISWTVLPFHNMAFTSVPNSEPILTELQSHGLQSGLYTLPGVEEGKADPEAFKEMYKRGPIVAFMVYLAEGRSMMDPMMFIRGLLLTIVAAFVVSLLVMMALPGLNSYMHRVLTVVAFGVFASCVGPLTLGNWMWFPAGYVWAEVFDQVIGWLLAGLVIATFVKKPAQA